MLAKDTHGKAIRLAPPMVISDGELDWAMDRFEDALLEARGAAVVLLAGRLDLVLARFQFALARS